MVTAGLVFVFSSSKLLVIKAPWDLVTTGSFFWTGLRLLLLYLWALLALDLRMAKLSAQVLWYGVVDVFDAVMHSLIVVRLLALWGRLLLKRWLASLLFIASFCSWLLSNPYASVIYFFLSAFVVLTEMKSSFGFSIISFGLADTIRGRILFLD